MAERVRVSWVSGIGVGHEEVIEGGRIDASCPQTTAVFRVYNGDRLSAVHTITGVDRIVWEPIGAKGEGDQRG